MLDDGSGEMVASIDQLGVAVHVVGGRSFPVTTLRLRRMLRRGHHDVVLAHGHHAGWLLVLAALGLRHRPTLVVARHHNLYHHLVARRARVLLDRLTIRWADAMVASSTSVADTLMAEGCPIERLMHATNGRAWDRHPDPKEVANRRADRSASCRLAAVGNLKEEKDYPTLIQALGIVVDSGRDVDLFVAGSGTDATQKELEQVALEAGISERVFFGGWCSDPAAVMLAADALVHVSIDEASPQAVYEAAGLGVPVIATWAGGIRDILGRYQDLVRPGDVEELAQGIIRVVDDLDAARMRAGLFAAEIRDRYSSDTCGSSYLKACSQAHSQRKNTI